MKSEKIKVVDVKDKKSQNNGDIEISEEKVSSSTSDDESTSNDESQNDTGNESDGEKLDITKLESDDSANNTDSSNDTDDNENSSDSTEKSEGSGSTCEILSKDPLFMVLTEFLMSKNGENICDILDKLNNNIKKLIKDT